MSAMNPDLIGISDQIVPEELETLDGMLPSQKLGGLTALFAEARYGVEGRRTDLALAAIALCPRMMPVVNSNLKYADLERHLMSRPNLISEEIDRLAGRLELIVTLSYPVPAATHAREGSGIRWLKRRAAHLRQLSLIRRRAVDSLESLSESVRGLTEAQCLAPFGSSRKSRIGADLALLVPRELVQPLGDQLAESAPRLLPSGADARCTLSGPLPAFSFAASLNTFSVDADWLRTAS